MPRPTAAEQVRFLQNIQRILDEGSFVATYKFALLLALADLSIEQGDDLGSALVLPASDIAERFVRYYWRQAVPFPSPSTGPRVLRQNTGRQAAIVRAVVKAQQCSDFSLPRLRRRPAMWRSLLKEVDRIVQVMPLWKLQTVGTKRLEFMYLNAAEGRAVRSIELLPGVASCFRLFHGLIRTLIQGRWVAFVRELSANREVMGQNVDLGDFLFGATREPVSACRALLLDLQQGQCFYCRRPVRTAGDLDHFIAWSRYPHDLGHNFVLAHGECNRAKSSHLAAEVHLEAWQARNDAHGPVLTDYFRSHDVAVSLETSTRIAAWAYSQAESAGAQVWVEGSTLKPLSFGWRQLLEPPSPPADPAPAPPPHT